jgi:N-acylneuraminate cytidylyltransferase
MRIAIIPARGGSKRIPHKNIREFCGKPMLAWSILTAKVSGLFDHIVVSTDSEEIAACARDYGAEVPFFRPAELADDFTTTRKVINHAIHECAVHFGSPAMVCCIYATAPFIEPQDLKDAFSLLEQADRDFVFSATSYPFPIQRAFHFTKNGDIEMFQPEHRNTRSQDLEPAFHDAAQFYWGKAQAFLDGLPMFSGRSLPMILPRSKVIDIDTPEDWDYAEFMWRAYQLRMQVVVEGT